MTTYTSISNGLVAVGAKPFATTIQALRDNPIAIAEADSTAPVNQGNWHPYNKVTNGDANTGSFYSGATVASIVTPDFVDGYDYMVTWTGLSHNAGTTEALQVEFYREVGAAYNPAASLGAGSLGAASTTAEGWIELTDVRKVKNRFLTPYSIISQSAATSLGNSSLAAQSLNYLQNVVVTPQKILRVRFTPTAGSFDAGNMYLYRRRLIV
jgi:hypothetical protein